MKKYKCKNCGRDISLISYIPEDEENPTEDDVKRGCFHCPNCGILSYNDVEETEV